ncbi:MAG: apolipoprotein N-acyltransferase [Spirochaetales bacterium]|nr:apolipoprotein N-acyltransferase [Spirochaetales bacterium]
MKKSNRQHIQEPPDASFPLAVRLFCLAGIPAVSVAAGLLPLFMGINILFSVFMLFAFTGVSAAGLVFTLKRISLSLKDTRTLAGLITASITTGLVGCLFTLLVIDVEFSTRMIVSVLYAAVFFISGTALIVLFRCRETRPHISPVYRFIVRTIEAIFLLSLGSFFYALSFPGFANEWGMFPFAFIALVPVFLVINRVKLRFAPLAGIFFGILAHFLLNYWLATFHPLAIIVALAYRAVFFAIAFTALKAVVLFFPRWGFIFQCVVWVAYEYLTSLGFSGYPYGFMGYTQYLFSPLMQSASLGGVWLVSFLVIFPAAFAAAVLTKGLKQIKQRLKTIKTGGVVFAGIFCFLLVFGFVIQKDYSSNPEWKAALIQPNIDPWKGGNAVYESSLKTLIALSEEAIKQEPDIVVWPETAVVPSVRFHSQYRFDQFRYNRVVKPFLEFLDTQKIPYLTGNVDGELIGRDARGNYERKDYNAAILFEGREIKGVYRKTHLVPYTEHFPFKDLFPEIYQWLLNADTHFWEEGGEMDKSHVFESNGVRYSTPVCFEDCFGYITRRFVENGAEVIVNITNDAWSKSRVQLMQHICIAVFRSVETRRATIRSSANGITTAFDPNGKILAMAEPMTESSIVVKVPIVNDETTLYTLWGDWFGLFASIITGILFLAGGILLLKNRLFVKKAVYSGNEEA